MGWGWGCQHEWGTRMDEDVTPDNPLFVAAVAEPPSARRRVPVAAAGATVFCVHIGQRIRDKRHYIRDN